VSYRDDDISKAAFGHIEFVGKDISVAAQRFDRIAHTGRGELLVLSLVAEQHNVKRIRAILLGGAKAQITASGVRTKQNSAEDWRASTPGRMLATPDGYQVFTHKLGFGLIHALFMTRMPGFMKVVTPESLWQELKKERFTTPIIKEWMPYIEGKLREGELLEDAHVFNCNCGVLSAVTKQLDAIVCEGIQLGQLHMPVPGAAYTQPEKTPALMSA
jgi:hypothetical protein